MTPAAVLVLSGSSGRVENDRVRLLTEHGAVALSVRWFGGVGQPSQICEVPLETFTPALDHLAERSDHLAVLGTSKGAEAALLLAVHDPRIRTVVALSPTSVVWEGIGGTGDPCSSWAVGGTPLPFVPYDPTWSPREDPPAFRSLYEQSLHIAPERVAAATIPVERIQGRVLVSGGNDDQVWPSDRFAADIAARRAAHGLPTTSVVSERAGHRLTFPGGVASHGWESDGARRLRRCRRRTRGVGLGGTARRVVARLMSSATQKGGSSGRSGQSSVGSPVLAAILAWWARVASKTYWVLKPW